MTDTAVRNSCAVNALGNTSGSNERPATKFGSPCSEEELEAHIEAAKQRMCEAPDRTLKMQYWREMCRLIDQRTPARRRFMERVAGLR